MITRIDRNAYVKREHGRMVNEPHCYLCGAGDLRKVHDKVRFSSEFKPYECRECGLISLHPYFSDSELNTFYTDTYRSLFGEETPSELFERCSPEAKKRVERFGQLLRGGEKVIEIGSSAGHFLMEAQDSCGSVFGVEPGESVRQYATALGIDVRADISDYRGEEFDTVFLFHVLEHLQDPVGFLSSLRAYSKGKVVIEVPNVRDILVSVYQIDEFKDAYFSAPHKFYFSKESLQRVTEEAGYSCRVFPYQRYDVSNHIYWLLKREPGGMGHFRNIFSDRLDEEYANCLKESFLCDTIYAICEKRK